MALWAGAAHAQNEQTPPAQQPNGQYPQQPNGQYSQQPNGQYLQQPNGQYPQQPNGQYAQPPNGQYAQPPNGQYAQPPNGQYAQPPNGQYAQPPNGQYAQPPYGQYPQQPYGYPQQPYGYPQPPYGYPPQPYGYPQQPPSPALVAQRQQLNLQLERLHAERTQYDLTVPIGMMAVGGAVTAYAGLMFAVIQMVPDRSCERYEECSSVDTTGLAVGVAVVGIAAAGVTVAGLVTLLKRLGPRRRLAAEIEQKRAELRSVKSRMGLGPLVGPLGARGITVGLNF